MVGQWVKMAGSLFVKDLFILINNQYIKFDFKNDLFPIRQIF